MQAFYVHKGAVQVTVHRTRSILSEGSQFLIPRGEFPAPLVAMEHVN
jgi:quercetin dioxygenase-like cupin family protein